MYFSKAKADEEIIHDEIGEPRVRRLALWKYAGAQLFVVGTRRIIQKKNYDADKILERNLFEIWLGDNISAFAILLNRKCCEKLHSIFAGDIDFIFFDVKA